MRHFIRVIASRVPPQSFVRLMLVVSGIWLLAIYPLAHWFFWEELPANIRMEGGDFGQYYAGALAARHGLWPRLYPVPKQEIYDALPKFLPVIRSRFFDPDAALKRKGNWFFYPQIAAPKSASVAPELLALCPRLGRDYHYIYPPPLAVLLWPLGYFPYRAASHGIWFSLLSASFFGMAYFSSRICRILWRKPTYTEAFVAILPMVPVALGSSMSTSLSTGNISPFLGCLIAGVAYAWLRNKQSAIGFGMIPLLLFKGIGLSWCPLLLVKPIKRKTLGTLAVLTLLLNGAALYCGGLEPYLTFFREILPKAHIALGIDLPAMLLMLWGLDLGPFFPLLSLVLLGALYGGYWRQNKVAQSPSAVIATLAGTMAIFGLCNNIVWPHHYYTCYLMLPFSGWILWEGFQASGVWRKAIFVMFALSFVFWMDTVFLSRDAWLIEVIQNAGLYNWHVSLAHVIVNMVASYVLAPLEYAFLLVLAYRRLYFAAPVMEPSAVEEVAESSNS